MDSLSPCQNLKLNSAQDNLKIIIINNYNHNWTHFSKKIFSCSPFFEKKEVFFVTLAMQHFHFFKFLFVFVLWFNYLKWLFFVHWLISIILWFLVNVIKKKNKKNLQEFGYFPNLLNEIRLIFGQLCE